LLREARGLTRTQAPLRWPLPRGSLNHTGDPSMSRTLFSITVELLLAGVVLVVLGGLALTYSGTEVAVAGEQVVARLEEQPTSTVHEGRIKDVRSALGVLILTVDKGKDKCDLRLNMSQARILGPSGGEWKADDLRNGDRVRVELTADLRLVQQIRVLEE